MVTFAKSIFYKYRITGPPLSLDRSIVRRSCIFNHIGNEICHDLLEKGRQAYAGGRYQEAGRYFNRAVNLNPVAMSMFWYQIQAERQNAASGGLDAADPGMPRPQSEKQPIEEPPAEDVQIIIGDDEGC